MLRAMSTSAKQLKITDIFSRNPRKRALDEVEHSEASAAKTSGLLGDMNKDAIGAEPIKKPRPNVEALDISKENHLPSIPKQFGNSYGDKLIATLKDPGWKRVLSEEFRKPYMKKIFTVLENEEKKGVKIFPPRDLIFNAFNLTPIDKVKVVLLGQDPYHNDHQAHGLCFSVQKNVPPPPSLLNIYKELKNDISEFNIPAHGCLEEWAKQGVFLLNATLTVKAHQANSHSNIGWQQFTDSVIKILNAQKTGIIFLLWGGFAHKKEYLIDKKKHAIIKTAHPSPLSYRLFQGCKCFSKVNEFLDRFKKDHINWNCL